MAKFPKIKFSITSILCVLYLSGCSILPWPSQLITISADVLTTLNSGKGIGEHAVSKVTQLDCQWNRLFSDWKVCLTHEEYVDNLMIMGCHTYSWNFLNIPYCKNSNVIEKEEY